MTLTLGRLDDACHNGGYLSAAGRACAVKALGCVHADHYAGRVQQLDRAFVVGRDAAQIADGVVADPGHVLLAYGFREHVRKIVPVYAPAQITEGGRRRRKELTCLTVSIISSIPCLIGVGITYEVVVIRSVDACGDGYRLGPAYVVVRAEGFVSASDHNTLVVCSLDAGIVPVE